MQRRVVLTATDGRLIATSADLRDANVTVYGDSVMIERGGSHLLARLPRQPIRDGNRVVAYAYVFLDRAPVAERQIATLDKRLVITFAVATLVAILLALFLAQRITRPIERLTAAVDEMARGRAPSPVPASGRDEIAQLAVSFNAMAASITTQQELRRRMVGDVAHELRTPLTNLRCELEAIQDGLTTPDPARTASLHEEILHLGRLVDDLQELSVAEAGGMHLEMAEVEAGAVVDRVIDRLRAEAERKRIAIDVRREEAHVRADRTRLDQIVRNLLVNALQHTPEGGRIEVKVGRDTTNAVVSIADNGPGIPDSEKEKIFERFYRLDESRTRSSGGAGLGLAIAKQIVLAHGGAIWAESTVGQGTAIRIALPIATTPAELAGVPTPYW
jgi:signal transduction histidine kinase